MAGGVDDAIGELYDVTDKLACAVELHDFGVAGAAIETLRAKINELERQLLARPEE